MSNRGWMRLVVPVAAGVTLGMVAVSLVWTLSQGIYQIQGVLWPLAMALLLAYIFDPLVVWLQRHWKWPRLLSTFVLFLVSYAALVMLLIWLIPRVTYQIIDLGHRVPSMIDRGRAWLEVHRDWLTLGRPHGPATAPASEPEAPHQATQVLRADYAAVASVVERSLEFAGTGLSIIFNTLSLLILVPFYTFVLLWRFDRIKIRLAGWIPERARPRVIEIASHVDSAVAAFFRGRLLVCTIVGALTWAAWSIIGVPFALLLGVLTGIMNLVPFMAILVSLPIAIVVALFGPIEMHASQLVLTIVTFSAIQMLDGFLLTPLIQGKAAGLHPITVIVVLLAGSVLMGPFGLLLAVPVASAIKVIHVEWLGPRLRQWLHTGPPPAWQRIRERLAKPGGPGPTRADPGDEKKSDE